MKMPYKAAPPKPVEAEEPSGKQPAAKAPASEPLTNVQVKAALEGLHTLMVQQGMRDNPQVVQAAEVLRLMEGK